MSADDVRSNDHREREMTEFEKQLAALRPAESRVNRDRLMFEAGQDAAARAGKASASLPRWFWPSATAAMTVAAGFLGVLLAINAGPRATVETAVVQPPAPDSNVAAVPAKDQSKIEAIDWSLEIDAMGASLASRNYLHARQIALAIGVDGLIAISSAERSTAPRKAEKPVDYRSLLKEALQLGG